MKSDTLQRSVFFNICGMLTGVILDVKVKKIAYSHALYYALIIFLR